MQALKQSTAATILVGPVLDASGLAVTTAVLADFNITKNGTSATLTGSTVTHSHNGHYTIALTTGNTDTLGRLTISVNNSAMAMSPYRYTVLAAAVFDTLVTNGTLASTTSGRTITVDASGNASANIIQVAGVAAAIGTATVSTSSTTTSVTTSACSPAGAAADQFKGRVIIFGNSTTTTALRGCAALITASSNSATPTFTLAAALPTSPVSGDTFVIA